MIPRVTTTLVGLLLAAFLSTTTAQPLPDAMPFQERQCIKRGWHVLMLDIGAIPRRILWKGPEGVWPRGAIIVMHGGGGHHFQFCVANARILAPQVKFTELAVTKGFAVFLLESSDRVTDNEGLPCGKVWDDEVRDRPNLDLPFIGTVIRTIIPNARPPGSSEAVFLTGLSSGGYMTLRAATHFGNLITAFAPISSGDPYGWHRVCEKGRSTRKTVHGLGYDNETGKQIIEPGACYAKNHINEKPWDGKDIVPKPIFQAFHHRYDGINDLSCMEKAITQLRKHDYPEVSAFLLDGNRRRSLGNHFWQDAYNEPLLEFFTRQLRPQQVP